jgi:hypothetical protein
MDQKARLIAEMMDLKLVKKQLQDQSNKVHTILKQAIRLLKQS